MSNQRLGTNQNSFDPAENCGVCSDAERQAQDCGDRESRCAPKHSRAETHVLEKFVSPSPDALVAGGFLDLLDPAELSKRRISRVINLST
jgi:hypothetical protein